MTEPRTETQRRSSLSIDLVMEGVYFIGAIKAALGAGTGMHVTVDIADCSRVATKRRRKGVRGGNASGGNRDRTGGSGKGSRERSVCRGLKIGVRW